jgi:type II secretory pathway pseudopilin PulG
MRKYGTQLGFTIIEIMGVVAIIGILLILVVPSVKMNAIRAKMSEVILAFDPCKQMISEVYASGGDPPAPGNPWGCEVGPNATTYVDQVTTTNEGVIIVQLHGFNDGRFNTHQVTLAPLDSTGNLTSGAPVARWRCGSPADPGGGTDVLPQYLPASCRGG